MTFFISFRMKFGFYYIFRKKTFTYDRIVLNRSKFGNTSKIEYYELCFPFPSHYHSIEMRVVDKPLLIRLHPLAILRLATFQPKNSNCPLTVHLKANRLPNITSSWWAGGGVFLVKVSKCALLCHTNVVKIHKGQCSVYYINDVMHTYIPMIC